MSRVLVYVHFNPYQQLSEHVLYQLKKIRPIFSKVIFISNSPLSQADQEKIKLGGLADQVILRDNVGYDFAAWRQGVELLIAEEWRQIESLTLMNDTCFGPLWDLEPLYQKFESKKTVDFWGMTRHPECHIKGGSFVAEHLQSYFMVFTRSVFVSQAFGEFWSSVGQLENVQQVIDSYEATLTQKLVDSDFHFEAVSDALEENEMNLEPNLSMCHPDLLLKYKIPFIKVKAFNFNPLLSPYLLDEISKSSTYPKSIMIAHLTLISPPAPIYLLPYKIIKNDGSHVDDQKVALHVHVTDLEKFQLIFPHLQQYAKFCDYFLTYSSSFLEKKASQFSLPVCSSMTIEQANDLEALKEIRDLVGAYEVVGHITTDRLFNKEIVDYQLSEKLYQSFFDNLPDVLAEFSKNGKLGIVIPDELSLFTYDKTAYFSKSLALSSEKLWKKLGLQKQIDFLNRQPWLEAEYSTFWIRKEVLEFILENVPTGDPKLLRHLIVSLVWAQHYDYSILPLGQNSLNLIHEFAFFHANIQNEFRLPNEFWRHTSLSQVLQFEKKAISLAIDYIVRRSHLTKKYKRKK